MSILIRNGRLITATEDSIADVLVEGERVAAVGANLNLPADRVIDATGKYLIPGGIDAHTHLDMPFCGITTSDNFETGTRAAAFGGTTSILDFATQARGMSLRASLDLWLEKGKRATLDFGLHMIVTNLPDPNLSELDQMVQAGVTSFKLFMAYPDTLMLDDAAIFRVLRWAAGTGALVMVHAENGTVIDLLVREALEAGRKAPLQHALTRPTETEAEAVGRAISLAHMAGARLYIVHVSAAGALRRIGEAAWQGTRVYAETCPQYLLLTQSDLDRPEFEGAKYVYSPPARDTSDGEALWDGIRSGAVQVVATDHCPVLWADKLKGARQDFTKIPNGGPGIENRMQLLFHYGVLTGRLSLSRWVEVTSTAPARIFGLYPRKGCIAAGSDADLVIWNPDEEHIISATTHHMRVDYSLYEGFHVRGAAETVLSRGEIVVHRGHWHGRPGRGQFLKRKIQ
jgi:dihydropyrimidinase